MKRRLSRNDCVREIWCEKMKKPICGLLFPRTTKSCSMADVMESCRVQRSTLAVRALAAASGGSAGGVGI